MLYLPVQVRRRAARGRRPARRHGRRRGRPCDRGRGGRRGRRWNVEPAPRPHPELTLCLENDRRATTIASATTLDEAAARRDRAAMAVILRTRLPLLELADAVMLMSAVGRGARLADGRSAAHGAIRDAQGGLRAHLRSSRVARAARKCAPSGHFVTQGVQLWRAWELRRPPSCGRHDTPAPASATGVAVEEAPRDAHFWHIRAL